MARAKKKCGHAGCPDLTATGAFCPKHEKEHPNARWQRGSPSSRDRPPAELRRWIKHRDRGLCQLCGRPGHQVDHILPVAWGGTHIRGNLQYICDSCHRKKTNEERTLGGKYHGKPPIEVIVAHIRAWSKAG